MGWHPWMYFDGRTGYQWAFHFDCSCRECARHQSRHRDERGHLIEATVGDRLEPGSKFLRDDAKRLGISYTEYAKRFRLDVADLLFGELREAALAERRYHESPL